MDKIYFSDDQKIKFDFDFNLKMIELYDITFKILKLKPKPISVTLVTKKEIKKINAKYRNNNKVTDVISFSFKDNNLDNFILGEIYICIKQAIIQAKQFQHSLQRELCFLFVHGLLHILSYNHIEKKEEEIMFKLQDKILLKAKVNR